jgi:hypothetical protein
MEEPGRMSLLIRIRGDYETQVWGFTKTDAKWSTALDEALTTTRRADLNHGTNGSVCGGLCL